MKKFNWGHGIALFYVVFVGAVVTALVASFGVDHTLVVDDYYAQDLAYQNTYDKQSNSIIDTPVRIKINALANQISLHFETEGKVDGQVHFYRASDQSKDFVIPINDRQMTLSSSDLAKGKWTLKLDWNQDGKKYYKEEIVYL